MSRPSAERLNDILAASDTIADYLRLDGADESVVFDALRMRLIEIGEATKNVPAELLAKEPQIPWADITGVRDLLAHRYLDTVHAIVFHAARVEVPQLAAAARRLQRLRVGSDWNSN